MFPYLSLFFVLLASSVPFTDAIRQRAAIVGRDVALSPSYDFIIVGGGTSGLTVADRLTESPKTTVLVVEYGPFDNHEPSVLVPGLLNLTATPYLFNVTSVPQKALENHSFRVPAGAVVGGSTVVNGMFFDRGAAADYDAWTELGNNGWGWKDLLHYFEKSENFTPASTAYANEYDISWDTAVHGSSGPVHSSYPVFQFPSIKNFFHGWNSIGILTPRDPGDGVKSGAFWGPSSLDPKDETRSYARVAHYDPVIQYRPNYHLVANSAVTEITFEGNAATGIKYINRNSAESSTVGANKEVVLAAGAVHTPQILQLSGIGPKALEQGLNIEPIVDLPGVGQNFQDHPTLFGIFNLTQNLIPNVDMLTTDPSYAAEQLALYWDKRQGAYTIVNQGGNCVAFLPLPDITPNYQSLIDRARSISASSIYSNHDPSVIAGYEAQRELILRLYASRTTSVQETGFSSSTYLPITLVKPLSRGSIVINSTDPLASPVVDWASLTAPTDLDILIAALRINRNLMASAPMQELGPVEVSPGANLTSDDDLRAALPGLIQPTYSHPCCTCPMMPRELGGVVGPDLRVYGVRGLSVADASIMPMIPATHLSATVYAVAEKAADLIKNRHRLYQ